MRSHVMEPGACHDRAKSGAAGEALDRLVQIAVRLAVAGDQPADYRHNGTQIKQVRGA